MTTLPLNQPVDGPPPILSAERLRVGYGDRPLLPSISFAVRPGEQWVVVGRNGSGKSTLLKTMLGLLPPVDGRITRAPGTTLAYVPQRYPLDPTVPVRAIDLVAEGLESGWSFLSPLRPPGSRARVHEALERVGAEALAQRRFDTLSEGQKQRVLLARALVGRPSLILLDEPTSAMDLLAEQQTLAILDALRRDLGTSVMLVSHHLEATMALATQAIFVDSEHQTVAVGAVASVLANPTFHHHFGGLVSDAHSGCEPEGPTHG
ncbi:Zinc import ATP-binding protein ZnuC [compost metagenome]